LETPLLLERSGIGDPERLTQAGIKPRISSKRVGEGLREQRAVTVKARLLPRLGLNEQFSRRFGVSRLVLRYLLTQSGPLAAPVYGLAASVSTDDVLKPDLQLLLTQLSTDATGLNVADKAG